MSRINTYTMREMGTLSGYNSDISPVMIQMNTTSMDIESERSSAEVNRPQ